MSEQKDLWVLAKPGEKSDLHIALNRGVASLLQAEESFFQPHLCLNEQDGLRVIGEIARNPEAANTYISISEEMIWGGSDGLWLNVKFYVCLSEHGEIGGNNCVLLTPRQTSYIILRLPDELQKIVLQKIKDWYLNYLCPKIQKSLAEVGQQIQGNKLLVAGDRANRVFDIHDTEGGRSGWDVPYVEWRIAGEQLFSTFFHGPTLLEHGQDGYRKLDLMLATADRQRGAAVEGIINLARALRRP